MKHTRNMIYKPTCESRELSLYTINTGDLYRGITTAIIGNLRRKYQKDQYDRKRATDLWYNLANEAAKRYCHEFGGTWNQVFDVTSRYTAAVEFEEYYREQVEED